MGSSSSSQRAAPSGRGSQICASALRQVRYARSLQGAQGDGTLVRAGRHAVRKAAPLHHFLHREIKGHGVLLRHDRAHQRQLRGGVARQGPVAQAHLACLRRALAREHGQQCAFARAIGPEDGGKAPRLQRRIHGGQPGAIGQTHAQRVAFQCVHTLPLNWRSIAKNSGTPMKAVSTPAAAQPVAPPCALRHLRPPPAPRPAAPSPAAPRGGLARPPGAPSAGPPNQ